MSPFKYRFADLLERRRRVIFFKYLCVGTRGQYKSFFDSGDEENRLTQVGNILGTVDYIAPEQAENARIADVRSDIYSLGCALYYLLAGRPPYPGTTVVEKISARLIGSPRSLREIRPEVSPELEIVLGHMLARNPDERYQTPLDVALALAPYFPASA